eukprot:gene17754-21175_t
MLGDKDTSKVATQELVTVIQTLDQANLPFFMGCLLDIENVNPLARKESIRLIGFIVSLHKTRVSAYLQRIVAALTASLTDSYAGTSELCAETLGAVANHLNTATTSAMPLDIFLEPCYALLRDGNRSKQVVGASAIAAIAENAHLNHLVPHMTPIAINLLERIHSSSCHAALLSTLGRLIMVAGNYLESDSSLIAATTSRFLGSSDWMVRKAAIDVLSAIVTRISRDTLRQYGDSVVVALDTCKYDKIKTVRDLANATASKYRALEHGHQSPGNIPIPHNVCQLTATHATTIAITFHSIHTFTIAKRSQTST